MLKTLKKDRLKRTSFKNKEFFALLARYINNSQCYFKRKYYNFNFATLKVNQRPSFNCFCVLSGRSRSVFSKFKVSRIVFKAFSISKAV